MKQEELDALVEEARAIARRLRGRVFNCVDATGKYDREWLSMADLMTRLCDQIDGTEPCVRAAIEISILFGAKPEEAEKLKNDPDFIAKAKQSADELKRIIESQKKRETKE